MNHIRSLATPALAVAVLIALPSVQAQVTNASLHLRLAPTNNRVDLILDGTANSGALFIYQASDPRRLAPCPPVVVQTNTPLTNGLRFSLPLSTRRFFQAAHPGGRWIITWSDLVRPVGGDFT